MNEKTLRVGKFAGRTGAVFMIDSRSDLRWEAQRSPRGAEHPLALRAALGVIGVICLGIGIARADPVAPASSVTIRVADLDLSQKADAVELYSRISRAAVRACGPFDSRSSYEQERMRACVKTAIVGAVERVNKPQLVALVRRPDGR
jgi:UrcA family protein